MLVTSQSPKNVSIQIVLHGSETPEEKIEENKDGVRFLGMLPFRKTQLHFPFSPFLYFRASDLRKIDANFSGEIVTSSAVLNHWVSNVSVNSKPDLPPGRPPGIRTF